MKGGINARTRQEFAGPRDRYEGVRLGRPETGYGPAVNGHDEPLTALGLAEDASTFIAQSAMGNGLWVHTPLSHMCDDGHRSDTFTRFAPLGVRGYSRSRTPVASKNAFAMAAAAGPVTSSPAPVDGWSSRWTTIGVTFGCSSNRRIG